MKEDDLPSAVTINYHVYSMVGVQTRQIKSNWIDNPHYGSGSGQNGRVIGRVDPFMSPKTLPVMELCRSYLLCTCKATILTLSLKRRDGLIGAGRSAL